jgi:hypothetical protein
MLTSSSPSDQTGFAVSHVVDCEPPAHDVRQCRPPSPAALRKRNAHAPQRHSRHERPVPAMSPSMREAAAFADAALRRVLEVIDRRRPGSQLNGLLAAGLADSVLSANRLTGGVAVLRRVRLQAVGGPDGFAAAEVFGSYSRGPRMHAIACRIERIGARRWQVAALHIG